MANWTVANKHGKIASGYHAIHSEAKPSETDGLAHLIAAADRAFPNNAPHKWLNLDDYYDDHKRLQFILDNTTSDKMWFDLLYFGRWRGVVYPSPREAISVAMHHYDQEIRFE